ncbi:MAG: glycosyltransferase family 4 protein [Terracidiphilus sp.]
MKTEMTAQAIDKPRALVENGTPFDGHCDRPQEERVAERPIRIAVVVTHPIQHFAPLHRKLASVGGIELKVFFCANWGAQSYFDREFGIELKWDIPLLDGYTSELLPGKENAKWLGFTGCDNPSIGAALQIFQPDVVQVFGYAHRTMWRAVDWCHRHRIPVLLFTDSNAAARVPLWKRLVKAIVVGLFYRRVDGACFVGDNNYDYHLRYGLTKDRLFPGALTIDQERLTQSAGDRPVARREIRAKYGIPDDAFVAIFSGKLSTRKSPIHLLQAVRRCWERGARIWALFVGEGSERDSMEESIREFRSKNAVLAGFVNQSTIGKYYAASEVLVVPSAYDPHPLVLPEAGCFGLPAIVSDRLGCIGMSDTARAGENALVYPFGDIDALTDCMMRLYSDKDMYRSMSRAALRIAESQDIAVAALALKDAAVRLKNMGVRR